MSADDPMLDPVKDVPELSDELGAQRLKAKIEAYWAERGYSVQLRIEPKGFTPQMRAARYDVRSDMQNGFPRPSPQQIERAA
jgi:hypothetical protein